MRFLLLLFIPLALTAQSRTAEYSIGGVVVNSQTGEPVKNALVSLLSFSDRGMASMKPAMTGLGGEFLFTGLAEGQYGVSSEKPGFTSEPNSPGAPRRNLIELKASLTDLRLKLTPLAVIEGRVLDQYGESAGGIRVLALSVKIVDGLRTTPSERSVTTDDQGYYRVWNLTPGKYYIKATGKGGGTYSYTGDNAILADGWEGFAPVFAGGARDLNSAIPIVIGPGTQARADVIIVRERAFKIRGVLGNFIQRKSVTFELLRGEEVVSTSRSTLNSTTGRFEIMDVTPGAYVLRATQDEKARAEANVSVSDRDVNNLALTLSPAVEVKVVLRLTDPTGDAATTADSRGRIARSDFCFCSIRLYGSGTGTPLSAMANSKNREAVVKDVLPGDYRVSLSCQGQYVTAVTAGRADLLYDPRLVVLPGANPEPIEITVKSGGGELSGELIVDPMPPVPGILLVPSMGALAGPTFQRMSSPAIAGGGAIFNFTTLVPGDYVAYAFSQADDIEFRNPEFLQSLRGGTSVHIAEGEKKEITITSVVK